MTTGITDGQGTERRSRRARPRSGHDPHPGRAGQAGSDPVQSDLVQRAPACV